MTIKKRVETLELKFKQKTRLPKIPSDFVEFNNLIGLPKSKIAPFDEIGEYPYFCMLHPWQVGIIIVE